MTIMKFYEGKYIDNCKKEKRIANGNLKSEEYQYVGYFIIWYLNCILLVSNLHISILEEES